MHKWSKVLAIVLGLAVLTSIVGTGAVFAADPQPTPTTPLHDVFLSKLAAKLNVSVDQLTSAMTGARTDAINQLAADGKITAEQKDWMLSRVQGTGTWGGFGRGMMGGRAWAGGGPPWGNSQQVPTK